jgi:hypothetical protein
VEEIRLIDIKREIISENKSPADKLHKRFFKDKVFFSTSWDRAVLVS